MSFKITRSNGNPFTPIQDYTIDTTTTLMLPGRGVVNYGQVIAQNFLWMVENYASPIPPTNPSVGQIWFQTTDNSDSNNSKHVMTIKVYTGDLSQGNPPGWKQVGGTNASSTPPTNPNVGDLWYDKDNKVLYSWDGNRWVNVSPISSEDAPTSPTGGPPTDGTKWTMLPEHTVWVYDSNLSNPEPPFTRTGGKNNGQQLQGGWRQVGPVAPSGAGTYTRYMPIKDTSNNTHNVLVQYHNGTPLYVLSNEYFEVPNGVIPNFDTFDHTGNGSQIIRAGMNGNMNYTKPDGSTEHFVLNANAMNAFRFDGHGTDDFLGRGNGGIATWPVSDNGTDLGTTGNRWKTIHATIVCPGHADINNPDVSNTNLLGKAVGAEWSDRLSRDVWIRLNGDVSGSGASNMSGDYNINLSLSDGIKNQINEAADAARRAMDAANNAANIGNNALTQNVADGRYIPFTGTGDRPVSGQLGSNDGNRFSRMYAERFIGEATSADYSDLAEYYHADADYIPGTIVKIGGGKEITQTTEQYDLDVFGIISTNPGVIMNEKMSSNPEYKHVALSGRIPVRVTGPISKGDKIVPSSVPGVAISVGKMADIMKLEEGERTNILHSIIGTSLGDSSISQEKAVECYVQSRH